MILQLGHKKILITPLSRELCSSERKLFVGRGGGASWSSGGPDDGRGCARWWLCGWTGAGAAVARLNHLSAGVGDDIDGCRRNRSSSVRWSGGGSAIGVKENEKMREEGDVVIGR